MKKILLVVGTRPNIIKITQFQKLAPRYPGLEIRIAHTGQHYDEKMASSFFTQLGVRPDFFLNVPAGSANTQVAQVMLGLEKVCMEWRPDLLMAVGDVNSTVAAALTANKLSIRLAHLEAGLRSNDRTMPEEHNRVITDHLSDLLFVTEVSGKENLLSEGKSEEQLKWVGNTMIDTLVAFESDIRNSPVVDELGLTRGNFVLMTMHRPSNVDTREGLEKMLILTRELGKSNAVVFPVHPRTLNRMQEFGLLPEFQQQAGKLILTEPKDYFSFQRLITDCRFVVTDSGGVQEETTFRRVPCFTLRPNTERPCTITEGTNELVTFDSIHAAIRQRFAKTSPERMPPFWDGQATARVLDILTGDW